MMDRINLLLQATTQFLILTDLIIEGQNLAPHVFVLADNREVSDADGDEKGYEKEEHDQFGQLVPDSEIDIHRIELSEILRRWKEQIRDILLCSDVLKAMNNGL